jgi:hypothetical protein
MIKTLSLPPLVDLQALLTYDPISGAFHWREAAHKGRNSIHNGKIAGSLSKDSGYRMIGIGGHLYRAHRLAWLFMTGAEPSAEIDHIDGNRANNGWANLRLAGHRENMCNRGKQSNNRSGHKGVSWSPEREKFQATIQHKGRSYGLGRFCNIEDAIAAYNRAARDYHGQFAFQNEGGR